MGSSPFSVFAQDSSGDITQLSFGRILPGQKVEQVIAFPNPTTSVLNVKDIQLSSPLLARNIKNRIAPNESGEFSLQIGEKRPPGQFKGLVRVNFENLNVLPVEFIVTGFFIPPIEFKPRQAFYIAGNLGKEKRATIEIINHRKKPLNILRTEHQSERFDIELQTLPFRVICQHYTFV